MKMYFTYRSLVNRLPFIGYRLSFTVYSLLFIVICFSSVNVYAQPSWAKKAGKSVFTLKTFDSEGNLLGNSTGFFVGSNGEALSSFTPFKGASRAVVIDASGKEMAVKAMLGANDTYDVARFRVDGQKTSPLTLAGGLVADGEQVWLLPYREVKNLPNGTITKAETFSGEYGYYTLSLAMPDNSVGAPLINEEGLVVGLMQQPYATDGTVRWYAPAMGLPRDSEM